MDTVDGTDVNARRVLGADARFTDDVCHVGVSSPSVLAEAKSITRRVGAALLLAVVPAGAAIRWRDDPGLAAAFAPAAHRAAYRASTTASSIDAAVNEARNDPALAASPGGWTIRDELPQDAFGTAGPYNRWQLALAYGSVRPRVARGVRTDRGRVVEAWTVISPYPAADLRSLREGTLRLVLEIAQ